MWTDDPAVGSHHGGQYAFYLAAFVVCHRFPVGHGRDSCRYRADVHCSFPGGEGSFELGELADRGGPNCDEYFYWSATGWFSGRPWFCTGHWFQQLALFIGRDGAVPDPWKILFLLRR